MLIAAILLGLLFLYLASGLVFGIAFVIFGVGQVDPAARQTSLAFRLLILPGAVAFWPFLAIKWIQVSQRGATP